jgi:hypothetical protein
LLRIEKLPNNKNLLHYDGFKFFHDDSYEEVYRTDDQVLMQRLREILKKKVNQSNFHDFYKAIKKIGKGNFASVMNSIKNIKK